MDARPRGLNADSRTVRVADRESSCVAESRSDSAPCNRVTNERVSRLAFWSMPTAFQLARAQTPPVSGRSMGRRRSSRSRNRSSSRPSRLSTDHPAMLTLCCPFSRPCDYPAVTLSTTARFRASFGRASTAREPLPLKCPRTRRNVHQADRATLMIRDCERYARFLV